VIKAGKRGKEACVVKNQAIETRLGGQRKKKKGRAMDRKYSRGGTIASGADRKPMVRFRMPWLRFRSARQQHSRPGQIQRDAEQDEAPSTRAGGPHRSPSTRGRSAALRLRGNHKSHRRRSPAVDTASHPKKNSSMIGGGKNRRKNAGGGR